MLQMSFSKGSWMTGRRPAKRLNSYRKWKISSNIVWGTDRLDEAEQRVAVWMKGAHIY